MEWHPPLQSPDHLTTLPCPPTVPAVTSLGLGVHPQSGIAWNSRPHHLALSTHCVCKHISWHRCPPSLRLASPISHHSPPHCVLASTLLFSYHLDNVQLIGPPPYSPHVFQGCTNVHLSILSSHILSLSLLPCYTSCKILQQLIHSFTII